jgi:uncharacterized protein (UPF0333 family)
MNPLNTKGQTALEYLLIVVVAIIVVVAVMVWMQSTTRTVVGGANTTVNGILCATHTCTTAADCPDVCGPSPSCDGSCKV